MPSYMVCSQLLIKWKTMMGGMQNSLPRPSLTYEQDDQEAVLGGPSSDETFPLREKIKF